jgi:hypothetical protein
MKTINGYKFIKKDMKSLNGDHTWKIGKWYKEDEIELCNKGFHACKEPLETLDYIYGDKFFLVEARGKIIHEKGDKFVASEMRLLKELPIDEIFKPFGIWCAKQCLPNYEKEYPNDKRVSDCIKATEDYLAGRISLAELGSIAESAKSAAESSWSAAESSGWSAESAKSAAESSGWSAWSAAWSAWSVARSVARSAAESVARSVAKSAAESAARSAESAESAKSAAWSAESARSAAWSAVRSAEKKKQNTKLKRIIKEFI